MRAGQTQPCCPWSWWVTCPIAGGRERGKERDGRGGGGGGGGGSEVNMVANSPTLTTSQKQMKRFPACSKAV